MNVETFRDLLAKGLGRAPLFLREHNPRPFYEALLEACVHNLSYDPQCEDSRADYLFEMIQGTPDRDFFRDRILQALRESYRYWDARQLFDLARLFAQEGHYQARQAMYEKFDRNDTARDFTGAEEIVRLDGIEGLLWVADRIGGQMLAEEDCLPPEGPLILAEESCGEQPTWSALEEVARRNERVHAYWTGVRKRRAGDGPVQEYTYYRLQEALASWRGRPAREWLFRWSKNASEEDVRRVATELQTEKRRAYLQAYLHIFRYRAFPLPPDRLIQWARADRGEVSEAALLALGNLRHDSLRPLALELLGQGRISAGVLRLLVHHYQEGDHRLVAAALAEDCNPREYHRRGSVALEIFEENPTPDCQAALLALYEKGPCSLCREWGIDLLLAHSILPDWMARECLFDANFQIRAKVAQGQHGGTNGTA